MFFDSIKYKSLPDSDTIDRIDEIEKNIKKIEDEIKDEEELLSNYNHGINEVELLMKILDNVTEYKEYYENYDLYLDCDFTSNDLEKAHKEYRKLIAKCTLNLNLNKKIVLSLRSQVYELRVSVTDRYIMNREKIQ